MNNISSYYEFITEANSDYLKWKKKNVTLRGIRNPDSNEENGVSGSLGRGLYTAFLSNKSMAKEYGTVKFVVNAIPKNPKVFNNLNEWEIWFYNTLVFKFSKENGNEFPDMRDFNRKTTIEDELQKMGYDGIIIKGREMVNFKPSNVKYFKDEEQLKMYYDFFKTNESTNFDKLVEESIKGKIDYYYLDYDLSLSKISEMRDLMETGIYRAIATFSNNIGAFETFDVKKIALVNYPPVRYTKHNLKNEIKSIIDIVDEIEFPWNFKYHSWKKEDWDEIVLLCSDKGVKLRPMLEIGVQDNKIITEIINYLKTIGIYSIMTSTGLISDITTIEKWETIKDKIPRIFEVKIGGIISISDLNQFLESDIDLAATTMNFRFDED